MPAVRRITGREQLQLVRHRNRYGIDDRALRRSAFRGELTKLRSGAFVETALWDALGDEDRARLEVAAAWEAGRGFFVASHASAAALWEVPRISTPDGLVHSLTSLAAGTRTEHGVRKHAAKDLEQHVVAVHGIACTSLERTIVDLAMTEPFADAVVAADWALREHTSKDAIARVLDELSPGRGRRRVEQVIDFADPRAGSAGESFSRTLIAEHGFPAPVLQQRFDDEHGLIGFVDFYWPDQALVGEFDGLVKYRDPGLLQGRSPEDVVIAEKLREDRLRATGARCTRWVWATLRRPGELAAQLRLAGLPSRGRRA